MGNREIGEELNQLSRLLFDSAARKWQWAVALQVCSGVLAFVLGVANISGDVALAGAGLVTIVLVVSYTLRLWFEVQYGTAETMRRQSVLTEALDWPVERTQMSEWRNRVGKRIRSRFRSEPRNAGYYTTEEDQGPERLAEMTAESAFYTRHLYSNLKTWVWAAFGLALAISAVAVIVALTKTIPTSTDLLIGRAVFSVVPIVLAVDLFGWALRLGRLVSGIQRIEEGLERSLGAISVQLPEVLLLVSEYNCQVVGGFPIPSWLFHRWHDDIEKLWHQR